MCANVLFRATAVAMVLSASVVISTVSADADDKRQLADDEAPPEDAEEPVDWKQIWFVEDRPWKIKVTLYDMKAVDEQIRWKERKGLGIAGARGLVFETRDPIIVGTFNNALMMPLRVAIPDEPGYGAGGGTPYPNLGRIEVFTNKERTILIGINGDGFALGSENLRQQNKFFSWMIAQQLDDILFLKTERHIPREIHKALSGEAYIEGGKHNYEAIRNEARKVEAKSE